MGKIYNMEWRQKALKLTDEIGTAARHLYTQTQIAAQRSGCDLERKSKGASG